MDECIATEPECDDGPLTTEELAASLVLQAKRVEQIFSECEASYKAFHTRVAPDIDPIEDAQLVPKDKMRTWLEKHGLSLRPTFQEFFEVFLQDHKKDGCLLLSERAIDLNEDARILLGIRRAKKIMPLFELLEALTLLFE